MVELRVGVPHEAPVSLPGPVVEIPETLELLVPALHVDGSDHQLFMTPANPRRQTPDLLYLPIPLEDPGVKVLDLGVAGALDVTRILRRVVGHHHEWVGVEGVDEEPRAVVHGGVDGAAYRLAPQFPSQLLDAGEQRFGGLLVLRLEEAEEHEVVVVCPVVVVVVYGGDAPDGLAVTFGQEEVYPRVLVERVLLRVELFPFGDE